MTKKEVIKIAKKLTKHIQNKPYIRIKEINNAWYMVLTTVDDNSVVKTVYQINGVGQTIYLGHQVNDVVTLPFKRDVSIDELNKILWLTMETDVI